jgi:hypothetical protein
VKFVTNRPFAGRRSTGIGLSSSIRNAKARIGELAWGQIGGQSSRDSSFGGKLVAKQFGTFSTASTHNGLRPPAKTTHVAPFLPLP